MTDKIKITDKAKEFLATKAPNKTVTISMKQISGG